jgi:hypothetical protein
MDIPRRNKKCLCLILNADKCGKEFESIEKQEVNEVICECSYIAKNFSKEGTKA